MTNCDKYFVEDYFGEQLFTAGVVRKDNEAILAAAGFKALQFRYHKEGSLAVKTGRLLNAVSLAFSCSKKSIVVFHFPLHAGIYKLLMRLLKWRGISTIAIIIDIDGIRDNKPVLFEEEISILKNFDCIIAHNRSMAAMLAQQITAAKITTIDIFDYPAAGIAPKKIFEKKICIAANFGKAGFVYDLGKVSQLTFFLYGSNYDESKQAADKPVFYKGKFAPPILPTIAEGSFGLVWDGDSIDNCDPYLKINNPHKLSLYITAGMPVIVWAQSAVAAFVMENQIGITVNSLLDIDSALNGISEPGYTMMQQNVAAIAAKLRNGFYLEKAMDNAIELILRKGN